MRKFKKTLYCLLSAVVLTGCASSSNQLLKERENQPDNVFGTEEESTVAQINGVPADYISNGEPSFRYPVHSGIAHTGTIRYHFLLNLSFRF